jgi:exodeoxyribonuclease VII small subunit
MNETMKYEEALAQLETIVRKMESNEYDIDELAAQLKTAQQLITFCKDKLTKTDAELQKIMTSNSKNDSTSSPTPCAP